jgi:hypothetical protein
MLGLPLSAHAALRCRDRSIPREAIAAALDYGTRRVVRGAEVYTLGWRDIGRCALVGLDLSRFESIEVVVASSGKILTVYRNRRTRRIRHS